MANTKKYLFEPLTSTDAVVVTSLTQLSKRAKTSVNTLRRHLKTGVYYDPAGLFRIVQVNVETDENRVRPNNFRR
jgi:hypothetical protein